MKSLEMVRDHADPRYVVVARRANVTVHLSYLECYVSLHSHHYSA